MRHSLLKGRSEVKSPCSPGNDVAVATSTGGTPHKRISNKVLALHFALINVDNYALPAISHFQSLPVLFPTGILNTSTLPSDIDSTTHLKS